MLVGIQLFASLLFGTIGIIESEDKIHEDKQPQSTFITI